MSRANAWDLRHHRERLRRRRVHDGRSCNAGRYLPVTGLAGFDGRCPTIRQGIPVAIGVAERALRRTTLSARRRRYWEGRLARFAWHWSQRDIRDSVSVQPMQGPEALQFALPYRVAGGAS